MTGNLQRNPAAPPPFYAWTPTHTPCTNPSLPLISALSVEDALQPGREMIAAGYVLYSSAVVMALSTGTGMLSNTLSGPRFPKLHVHDVCPTTSDLTCA